LTIVNFAASDAVKEVACVKSAATIKKIKYPVNGLELCDTPTVDPDINTLFKNTENWQGRLGDNT
jgi:hypothetical protein